MPRYADWRIAASREYLEAQEDEPDWDSGEGCPDAASMDEELSELGL